MVQVFGGAAEGKDGALGKRSTVIRDWWGRAEDDDKGQGVAAAGGSSNPGPVWVHGGWVDSTHSSGTQQSDGKEARQPGAK